MALKPCPDCGRPVSKRAILCPGCGREIMYWTAGRIILAILMVMLMSAFISFLYGTVKVIR
jgi:predicted nucleic acid-binding Zn ribbon protein